MPSLFQGGIVYPFDPVPDPQGNNPKDGRPFIVLNSRSGMNSGELLKLVGITSVFYPQDAANLVSLPHGYQAKTRLNEESWALCTWIVARERSAVEIGRGFVDPVYLFQIAERLQFLGI